MSCDGLFAVIEEAKQKRSEFWRGKVHLEKTGFLKPWQEVFGCLLVSYLGFKQKEILCYNARYEKNADYVMSVIQEVS